MDVSSTSFTATQVVDFPVDSTRFDWENLRYFIAFARIRSLAAAARSLNVEHATVSRRIAALETALKVRLVDRRSHRYELTENGERIAQLGTACRKPLAL